MLQGTASEGAAILANDMQALQPEALQKWLMGNITDSPTSSVTCSQAQLLLPKPKLIRKTDDVAPEHIFSQCCRRLMKFWVFCSRGHKATPEGAEE